MRCVLHSNDTVRVTDSFACRGFQARLPDPLAARQRRKLEKEKGGR